MSKNGKVSFYKDQKAAKSQPEQTFRGEPALELQGAAVEIANDYTKKKHVFRIKWVFNKSTFNCDTFNIKYQFQNNFRLLGGAEFLLQAHDDSEMQQWVGSLKAQCDQTGTESRSQTLPASSQKDEPKRRSFFTLKKK